MNSTPEEIAVRWREQMLKGYLKLAILFALTKTPLHGYLILKRIKGWTLGVMTPTAGGLYPSLKELEEKGLIKGEWELKDRRKVYSITEKGKSVLREAVEKHFELAHSIRSWFFKALVELDIVDKVEIPSVMPPAVKVLLPYEDVSLEERIEALERLRRNFQRLGAIMDKMSENIAKRIEELKSAE